MSKDCSSFSAQLHQQSVEHHLKTIHSDYKLKETLNPLIQNSIYSQQPIPSIKVKPVDLAVKGKVIEEINA
jgi:hypothetical protein